MLRHLFVLPIAASLALASEHRFGDLVETEILPPGMGEVEVWTTLQRHPGKFNQNIVQRIRLESGLGRAWQASIYVDLQTGLEIDTNASIRSNGGLDGFALEFATQSSSPDSGALGTGMIFEMGVHPTAISWKWALLADVRLGRWLVATNLVPKPVWIYDARPARDAGPVFDSLPLDWSLGASYTWMPEVRVGAELLDHNEIARRDDRSAELEWRSSTWYLGPDLTLVAETSWLHLGALIALGEVPRGQNAWSAKLVGGIRL